MICPICNEKIYVTIEPGEPVERFYIEAKEVHKKCYMNRNEESNINNEAIITKHSMPLREFEDPEEYEEVVVIETDEVTKKPKVVGSKKQKVPKKNIKKMSDI